MSMIINKNLSVSSNLFTWSKESRTLIGDLSDLQGASILRQIYDDAVDVGMVIHSERTGADEVFYFEKRQTTEDGLAWIRYRPVNPALAETGLSVLLFND